MAVSYTITHAAGADAFAAGKPREWTTAVLESPGAPPNYDLAPDGKRLAAIVAQSVNAKPPTHLTFLLNFTDELRRLVPRSK